jgi:hypothetical protein
MTAAHAHGAASYRFDDVAANTHLSLGRNALLAGLALMLGASALLGLHLTSRRLDLVGVGASATNVVVGLFALRLGAAYRRAGRARALRATLEALDGSHLFYAAFGVAGLVGLAIQLVAMLRLL